jgi:hypothetical protein
MASSDSLFTIRPIDIAAKLLMVAGLPINNVYPSAINSDSGSIRSILSVIVHHKDKGKTSISRNPDRKEVTRCLSTGQLFLAVHGLARRDALLRSKWEGASSLSFETAHKVLQIESSLKEIFDTRLPVNQLRQIISKLRETIRIPVPKIRRRRTIIEWMEFNWVDIEPILREIARDRVLP